MRWPRRATRASLPPTQLDLAVAHWVRRRASPPLERAIKPLTYLGDEKLVFAAAACLWTFCRASRRGSPARECSNQIALTVALSAALPHVIKYFVDRERPDRKVVHGPRHGIPRSGNRWDSFPSGHAIQLGAMATIGSRMAGPHARWIAWPAAVAVASTRVLLLAHYLSDVLTGLALGFGIASLVSPLAGGKPSRTDAPNAQARPNGRQLAA